MTASITDPEAESDTMNDSGIPEPRTPSDAGYESPEPVAWAEVLAELHRWAIPALTAGSDVPIFGSPGWCALGDDEPYKSFAAVRAALAWWTENLRRAEQRVADDVASSHAISAAENWSGIASQPSHAELQRRRRW